MNLICSCDLLENSYLCGISNNYDYPLPPFGDVVICLKIRTFVVSATTPAVCQRINERLWFAWKFVPLWYQQQHWHYNGKSVSGCDLLENSYLCGISNNLTHIQDFPVLVVICLKIRTFVVSATTAYHYTIHWHWLWFAWKFVPLWYQQQPNTITLVNSWGCDLLENSYLCGISNNTARVTTHNYTVVICLKIRTFVVSATTDFNCLIV